jgi:hypothetical protein
MVFPSDVDAHGVLIGCYRKYKSYVFYSSGMDFKKKEIAEFESDPVSFDKKIEDLQRALVSEDKTYFARLFRQISYQVLPKLSSGKQDRNSLIISNEESDQLTIDKVNFFIELPVELSILDVLWTLLFAKLSSSGFDEINQFSYANLIDDGVFLGEGPEFLETINFQTYKLFRPYFKNYVLWKNRAIDCAENNYENQEDSTIFSLDLKEFFYSLDVDFSKLPSLVTDNKDLLKHFESYSFLSWIISKIHLTYRVKVAKVRKGLGERVFLPIGLPSSGFIANAYMASFDQRISATSGVDYYGRYVDDILIVKKGVSESSDSIDLLVSAFPEELKKTESQDDVFLLGQKSVVIQKTKIKVIKILSGYSESILTRLKTDIATPSEPRLMPNIDLSLDDFQNLIYGEENESIKVRDASNPDINQKYLMKYFSDYLYGHKNTLPTRKPRKGLTTKEAKIKDQIEKTLSSSLLMSLYAKWGAIFSFTFLCDSDKSLFVSLASKAKAAISGLSFSSKESAILDSQKPKILALLKKSLTLCLNLSISSAFALTLSGKNITGVLSQEIRNTGKILRESNMFNLRLCAFPMLPFCSKLPDNLYNVDLQKYLSFYSRDGIDKRKIQLSPTFVRPQDFFIYNILKSYDALNSIDYQEINNNYKDLYSGLGFTDCPEIEVSNISSAKKEYQKFHISVFGNNDNDDRSVVYLALANMNLSNHKMIIDHSKLGLDQNSFKRKRELYRLLNSSYLPRVKGVHRRVSPEALFGNAKTVAESESKETLSPVDFLVLPEASVPLEWLPEIAEFSRRSQIAVVCGIKYVLFDDRIINSVATILPTVSGQEHWAAFVFLREKNTYAPEEKRRIENNDYHWRDSSPAKNYVFTWRNVKFAVFNCYELTDIMSRAFFSTDNLDLLIATEFNKDISYFSSITESASRDLFCYVCQVNSSDYGDSKIIGPLKGYRKIIASISGGEKDGIHIGGIDVKELRKYLNAEHQKDFVDYKENCEKASNSAKNKNPDFTKLLQFCATSANRNKGK